jgi:hypothetical protein
MRLHRHLLAVPQPGGDALRAKHHAAAFLVVVGLAVLVSTVLIVRNGSDRRTDADDEEAVVDESTRVAMLEDLALARRLRERAAAIRRGRAKLPDPTMLRAAADGTGSCPHPVPSRRLRWLSGEALPSRGLAEQLEEVAQRLDVEPNPRAAREDAAALLTGPPHEIVFVVEELVLPTSHGPWAKSFVAGRVTGRAVLVDADAGLPLCAGRVSASNSEEVRIRDALDDRRAIFADFSRQVSKAVARADMHPVVTTK